MKKLCFLRWLKNKLLFMKLYHLLLFHTLLPFSLFGQNYTSFHTGNSTDLETIPSGGICLMGGASEDDNAMQWFLEHANGGDVLVLRTTGSDGYNNYLYSGLGVNVNSVETIVCNDPSASTEPYVLQKIEQAEAIWFAGGDQWTYISYWRNTPVDSLINLGIQERNIVIGGTSAGMAIQGGYYFSAQNGTVTSSTALANPFNNAVTVDSTSFIEHSQLANVITDTHFDNPDRKGRLTVFMARMFVDYGIAGSAIACDEYTAICIEDNGIAKVFGGYPTYDDNAYFIQTNCELPIQEPEVCVAASALTWNHSGQALKVYRVKGTATGSNTFDLNDWQTGTGGQWLNWSVNAGTFLEQSGNAINCGPLAIEENSQPAFDVYPNPTSKKIILKKIDSNLDANAIQLFTVDGRILDVPITYKDNTSAELDLSEEPSGVYFLMLFDGTERVFFERIIKN